jgi:hypothetical protein
VGCQRACLDVAASLYVHSVGAEPSQCYPLVEKMHQTNSLSENKRCTNLRVYPKNQNDHKGMNP